MRAARIVTVTSTAAASDSRCRAGLGQGLLAIESIASNLRHCWSSAALRHTRTRKPGPDGDFPVPGCCPFSFPLILAFALLGSQEPGCGVARTTTEMRYVTRRTSQSAPLDAAISFSPLILPSLPLAYQQTGPRLAPPNQSPRVATTILSRPGILHPRGDTRYVVVNSSQLACELPKSSRRPTTLLRQRHKIQP